MLEILDLSNNQLHGQVPDSIADLSSLLAVTFFLYPWTFCQHPKGLGKKSSNIYYVGFSDNIFSGTLPGLCTGLALQGMSADRYNFSGAFPMCLRSCSKLIRVHLDENQFLKMFLKYLVFIQTFFSLMGNKFTGEISSQLWNCKNIESFM